MRSVTALKTSYIFTLFHSTALAVRFLLLSAASGIGSCQSYTDCNPNIYYGSMLDDANNMSNIPPRKLLHDLIQSTHRTSLPYTSYSSSQKDVWDALSSLDSDESGENVWLIYGDKWTPVSPRDDGTCSSWNREHLWPRSRGVGEEGYDNTDLHHLRPADCNVNSARSNRLFGSCGIGSPLSMCTIPANSEAANDTERDSVSFLPPENSRGDIARAILYMDLRYDGDDGGGEASRNVIDLMATDCPDSHQMGYLSQLLEWHAADPPDEREEKRNNEVCEYWQGNRNPFVDFPHLAHAYFGSPKALTGDGMGYDCSMPMLSTPSPSKSPGEQTFDQGTCLEMQQGDVAIVGIQSTDPDMIVLLALDDLPAGGGLYITDNAWTGFELKSNEGVKKLTIPSDGIPSGTMFGYDAHSGSILYLGNSWTFGGGNFALSVSGDNVIVYCLNGDGSTQFLYAAIYQSDWSAGYPDASVFSSNESALPSTLPENCAVRLPESKRNVWYHGSFLGSKNEMLNAISNQVNWMNDGELSDFFTQFPSSPPSSSPTKAPVEPGSCGGMQSGDVAIVGIRSLDPDMIELLALSDLPGEAAIFITDNAWTGFAFKSNEGVKKLNVPPDGIPSGTIFGYDTSTESFLYLGDSWVGETGRLALSASGDNIVVYCINGGSINFLYAAIYQNDWSTENPDPTAFSTSESALPNSLSANTAISLVMSNKNYWYHGSFDGGKAELLMSIADQKNWSADDDSS